MSYTLTTNTSTTAIATWGSTSERFAITFTTTGAGTISTVDFCIGVGSGTPTGVACEIWNDSGGSPGTSVAVSNTRSVSGAGSRHTFTFASPVAVAAGTTYWVGINLASLSGGSVVNCGIASAGTQVDKYSSDSGSTWSAAQAWEMNYSIPVTETAPISRDNAIGFTLSTGSSSYTQSYTCTGSNLTLVVGFTTGTTDNVSSVTYNGVSMTQAQKVQMSGSNRWSYIYYLIGPSTGANNIVWTFGAGQDIVYGGAASYTGTNQSAIDGSQQDSVSSVTTMTNTQTVTANNSWVVAYFYVTGSNITASTGANFASTASDNIALSDTNGATASGTNSQTVTWTSSANGRSLSVSIAPAASGPANLKSFDGNVKANIKSISGNLIANVKSLSGNS